MYPGSHLTSQATGPTSQKKQGSFPACPQVGKQHFSSVFPGSNVASGFGTLSYADVVVMQNVLPHNSKEHHDERSMYDLRYRLYSASRVGSPCQGSTRGRTCAARRYLHSIPPEMCLTANSRSIKVRWLWRKHLKNHSCCACPSLFSNVQLDRPFSHSPAGGRNFAGVPRNRS